MYYRARVHDFFAVTLTYTQRIDVVLETTDPAADLNLFLMREVPGDVLWLGISDKPNPATERITSGWLQPGRYLIGVGAWKNASAYKLTVTDPDKR